MIEPIRPSSPQRGFTLIELMLSIFLVLLLMIGINQVFKMSSDTVGTARTISDMAVAQRTLGEQLTRDAAGWVSNGPYCYIHCEAAPDGSRRDTFAFFATGDFRRKTADNGSYISDTRSHEAFIWYGHLDPAPGDPLKDTLGREAMLLLPPVVQGNGERTVGLALPRTPAPDRNTAENYYRALASIPLSPLAKDSVSTALNAPPWRVQQSRYDLAGTTINEMRAEVRQYMSDVNATDSRALLNRGLVYRFQAVSVLPRPITSAVMSLNTPILLPNCSQMIVEFAGDYVTQDANTGQVTSSKPDGVIDWVEHTPNSQYNPTPVLRREIQWYGVPYLPLDSSRDVTTVGTVTSLAADSNKQPPYFEAQWPTGKPPIPPYTCIWTNESPKIVHVRIKVEDPANRIQDGPWFDYFLTPN